MKIIKLKWGMYSVRDVNGTEVAVANSYQKAKKIVKRGK